MSDRRSKRALSLVWLVPVLALAAGGYLAATTLLERGPEIKLTFTSARGVSAGTKILHKSVDLGSVTSVVLSPDLTHVDATARMRSDATPYLTDGARFWVVRPQLSASGVSGLTTLLSGSYVEMDPGGNGGEPQTAFQALEAPPGVRSDEPGTTFVLHAPTVAALGTGAPVYYRDVLVGEVLANHIAEGTGAISAEVFVQAPYDKRVRTGTVWWQASGVATTWEPMGLRVEFPSVQAALSGGVAFNVPSDAPDYPQAAAGTDYPLFEDEGAADRAAKRARVSYVLYLRSPVPGLGVGSPVQLYGRQVGNVGAMRVEGDTDGHPARVRATIDLLPGSVSLTGDVPGGDTVALGRRLVAGGMRASIVTTSYVSGAQAVSLEFQAGSPAVQPAMEGGLIVLPMAEDGGGMLTSIGGALTRLRSVPFRSLGTSVNGGLAALASVLRGLDPSVQARAITAMLQDIRASIARADATLGPTLRSLPATADEVGQQLVRANRALADLDASYGEGSGMQDKVARAIAGYYDTVRYVRLLADYLARHPEAIARGTTARGSER